MSDDYRPKTTEEITQQIDAARHLLGLLNYHQTYTIDDYPIGRRDRGKCELGVEYKKGEFRTTRRTTNKYGTWCKPKCSTYRSGAMVVVSGDVLEHETAWLEVDAYSIYLRWANGSLKPLCLSPFYSSPRREEKRYTIVTRTLAITGMGVTPDGMERRSEEVIPADPPEKIALWDAYIEPSRELRKFVRDRAMELYAAAPAK